MMINDKKLHIIIIDDDKNDLLLLYHLLNEHPVIDHIQMISSADASGDYMAQLYDHADEINLLVICDINLLDAYGPKHLKEVREVFPNAYLVAISGTPSTNSLFSTYPEIDNFIFKETAVDSIRELLENIVHKIQKQTING